MKSHECGSELEAEIAKRGSLLSCELEDIPDNGWKMLIEGIDRTPRHIIA
ncbi:Uncharacterised protein [Corynebacterium amycolatum]|nr:Uncharacterised protein [Corynebacterium amycolatum]